MCNLSMPIYIGCQKYNNNTICSIHMIKNMFDVELFFEEIKNHSRIELLKYDDFTN